MGWMKYQIFTPLLLLQLLNLFWYFLILRILFRYVLRRHVDIRTELRRDYRTLLTGNPDDDRSDDEGDDDEDTQKKK